jgi:glycosyltransferase involved in cell wall biosynthesis
MRICIPIHSFEPGGVERVALRLAETWQANGHDVTVVLGRDRGPTRGRAPALRYVTRPEPFSTAAWETPWLIWCLWRYLRRHPGPQHTDVIFCAGNTYTVVCVAMKLLLGRHCPPVLVKISNDLVRPDFPGPVQALYRLWLRAQGRLLDRFVALSDPMMPQLVAELGVDAERVTAIPDPALKDDEAIAPLLPRPASGEGRRFLAIARLNRQKNLPLLLDAFHRVALPGDGLTIAGDGPERRRIERRIAALGLSGSVTMAGHVADIRPLLDGAHALVLSSDYEGVPAAVIEALAAGRPVAATDCCASMNWLLADGAFGALAPVGDAPALGAAMVRAAVMPVNSAQMQGFAALFTLGKAAPAYLSAMQALAEQSGLHRPGAGGNRPDRTAPC